MKFTNNIWKLMKLFKTALMLASSEAKTKIVKILVEQEGININDKDDYLFYSKFVSIFWYFQILYGNYPNYYGQHLCLRLFIRLK